MTCPMCIQMQDTDYRLHTPRWVLSDVMIPAPKHPLGIAMMISTNQLKKVSRTY
jgi:hypothetical protein